MTFQNSRTEYQGRMHRVLEYIDQHLDQPLDLRTLAEIAYFSPYHFHRLFSAWMGETLGDYLRRRRVEVAAMRFAAQPRVTVLQTALSVGFSSAEAFTRAFNARFGCSPTAWRARQVALRGTQNSNPGQVNGKHGQAPAMTSAEYVVSPTINEETIMKVKLIDREPVTVAYLRHLGPYGESIARFWQESYVPWAKINKLRDHARYGISYDDPSITAAGQCRYDACAEVAADFVVNGGALKTVIPGGRYAALSFTGTVQQIEEAWTALLRDWLPASGFQLDARPSFEHYPKGSSYNPETGVFDCEICIPVIPL